VTVVNRRNAVLGWATWKVGKRVAKKKARDAVPKIEDNRPNKTAIALFVATIGGALLFWRSRSGGGEETISE
jgi:hypothetical protein